MKALQHNINIKSCKCIKMILIIVQASTELVMYSFHTIANYHTILSFGPVLYIIFKIFVACNIIRYRPARVFRSIRCHSDVFSGISQHYPLSNGTWAFKQYRKTSMSREWTDSRKQISSSIVLLVTQLKSCILEVDCRIPVQ